jgi:hypothetical protein
MDAPEMNFKRNAARNTAAKTDLTCYIVIFKRKGKWMQCVTHTHKTRPDENQDEHEQHSLHECFHSLLSTNFIR